MTESIGAAISGNSKLYASIRQPRFTSSSPRVRRDGTIAMSSKANACWARLVRPISNTWSPSDEPVTTVVGARALSYPE